MSYYGSWKIDDNLTFTCNTHNPATGAAADADSAPAYRIYEDETGTPVASGTMALLDAANTDGFYSEQVQLTAASGFEKGKAYHVHIAATVNSVTGSISHNFQIGAEVDVRAISGDITAADNLEAMLDGNRAKLSLTQLDIQATGNDPAILAQGAGTGSGARFIGGATGHGVNALGGATSGDGIRSGAQTSGIGLYVYGNGTGTAKHGIYTIGGGDSAGARFEGSGAGAGLDARAGATGPGINAAGGTGSAGIYATGTGGAGIYALGIGGAGIQAQGTATNHPGIYAVGGGSSPGLYALGGATGHGINALGGATSGDGIHAEAQTSGDGIDAVGAGAGVDLRADITGDITGNLSGSAGSVTGAVGSVTGNVGGSVASVTGAVGSVTGNVGGSVASVTGAVGSVTGNVGGNVTGSVGSLAAQAKTDVNAEVVDALATDTYAEPGQGAPAATASLAAKINYLYKFARNKITQTATTLSIFDDAGTTVDQKATVSDDATTYTRGEIGTGP